jgi:hypothetical protein
MKKIVLLFIITIIISSCIQKEKTTEVEKEKIRKEINTQLDNWHAAAAKANYSNYFNVLVDESVYIGTDAAEVWNKEAFSTFSKPYFDRGSAWSFNALNRNIYFSKNVDIVWFDELLDTWMGLCRGSGVLEKTDETWKIKHYVLSITVPNDNINAVININKDHDSIYKLKNFK